ncbi:MAG: Gfo/Idh/MocA family oxidoreductase [Chitinivibrionales bacterium]|nr:Gfo/Idh/MocA family oxidoreductase [Chitinivibrionales bacterium]
MKKHMDTVRWGIIGCGDVTEIKSGPAFQKVNGSALVAVMRRSADLAADYARRHAVAAWYSDADKLIHDPNVDAVYIATPPDAHADYTARAAAAGKPVYVEKPMARTYAECRQMVDVCKKNGVPLWVAYYRRAQPAFLKVKELLESGAIGAPRLVASALWHPVNPDDYKNKSRLPWRVIPEISGGGLLYDVGSHQLDMFDFLFGPIRVESIRGATANQAGYYVPEDIVCANFRFESGVMGAGSWCFAGCHKALTDRVEVVGSKGKISFSVFAHSWVLLETDELTQEFNLPPSEHVELHLIQKIVEELHGGEAAPSTGISAARTNLVMEKIIQNNI